MQTRTELKINVKLGKEHFMVEDIQYCPFKHSTFCAVMDDVMHLIDTNLEKYNKRAEDVTEIIIMADIHNNLPDTTHG